MDPRFLAIWLVARAYNLRSQGKPGPEGAIGDLERFVATDEIPIRYIAPVTGIYLDNAFDLADGLSLVPRAQISIPRFRRDSVDPTGVGLPEAFLVKTEILHREDSPSKATSFSHHLYKQSEELSEICRMLTIAKEASPKLIAIWEQTEDWVPCGDHLELSYISWRTSIQPEVTKLSLRALNLTKYLYSHYKKLPKKAKTTLDRSIDRINSAFGQQNVVDRAIDLGIAFEVFFFHSDTSKNEITFKLKMRAAHYLKRKLEARLLVAKAVGDTYELRSAAVHAGLISKQAASSTLLKGRKLLARALKKSILEGNIPNWKTIVYE